MVKENATCKTQKNIRKQISQANDTKRAVLLIGVLAGLLVACVQTGTGVAKRQFREASPVVTQTQQKDDEGDLSTDEVIVYSQVPFDTAKVYDIVERMPQFPGGHNALFEYLDKNLKYPPVCKDSSIFGRVIVCFVVERNGSISRARVARGIHPQLDAEALRVIKSMPKWYPGMQTGITVPVNYTLPVTFHPKYSAHWKIFLKSFGR